MFLHTCMMAWESKCRMGNSQTQALCACEWDALAQPNLWGDSAIHKHARRGTIRELTELYRRARSTGALVSADHARTLKVLNAPDGKGCTPLFISAETGHADMFTMLLQLGANPCIGDRLGRLPLHMACLRGSSSMVEALLQHPVRHWAGRRAQLELPTASGFTALHYAVCGGDVVTVAAVLEHKPQLTVPSTHATWMAGLHFPAGTTPLHVAAAVATPQVVRMLLAYHAVQVRAAHSRAMGPDPRILLDKRGRSAYQVAIRLRKHEVASLLDLSVPVMEYLPVLCGTTLQTLAANVLQQHLLATLASVRTAVSAAVADACAGPSSVPCLAHHRNSMEAASSTPSNANTSTNSIITTTITTATTNHNSTDSSSNTVDNSDSSSSLQQLIPVCCARRSHSTVLPALLWEIRASDSVASSCATERIMPAQQSAGVSVGCCAAPCDMARQLQSSTDDEDECSICFGSGQLVQLVPCRHQVCAECAAQVVARMGCQPATCPFCRNAIRSFKQPASGVSLTGRLCFLHQNCSQPSG